MMPYVLRRSGPNFLNKAGATVEPRALIGTCEDCGSPAPFGLTKNGKTLAYCGWANNEPVCKRSASHPSKSEKAA
jgi:hypothetical protein